MPSLDRDAIERVKAWTRDALGASPATAVAVNEIACMDPACPGVETVILVMEPGTRTRAVKVSRALHDVTELDIRKALSS
jgi:hypothetical protein